MASHGHGHGHGTGNDDTDPAATSISLPSLAVLAALLFVLARYFLRSSSSSSNTSTSGAATRGAMAAGRTPPVDRARVQQVAAMFPQLDRRTIAWELARNGGSVARAAERVLAGGTLERPPPSFQPPNLDEQAAPATGSASGASTATATAQQDLIARYNLSGKLAKQPEVVASDPAPSQPAPAQKSTGWASTKTERASLLAARRDAMILKARRDMEARDKAEKGRAGAQD